MGNPTIASDKVEGTTVYSPDGGKLGSIDNLIIDKRSGQVRYAALEFGGFLGMGTDRYPIPWSMLSYDTNLDGYVVPLQQVLDATESENRTVDFKRLFHFRCH